MTNQENFGMNDWFDLSDTSLITEARTAWSNREDRCKQCGKAKAYRDTQLCTTCTNEVTNQGDIDG
jgi:ribosomal protein S14